MPWIPVFREPGTRRIHAISRRAAEPGSLNLGIDLEDGPLSSPVITEY